MALDAVQTPAGPALRIEIGGSLVAPEPICRKAGAFPAGRARGMVPFVPRGFGGGWLVV
jgi:hypothetical protein